MSLQGSTDRTGLFWEIWRYAWCAACVLLLAACSSLPGLRQAPVNADAPVESAEVPQRLVPRRAQTLYEQAVAVMSGGDFAEAQLRFQEFLLQYPEFPGAYVNLAIIYAANGDDSAALESISTALTIDPDYPAALNQLGMLRRRQGKFLQAEAAYLKAIAADPDYPLAHYNLGVLNELYLQRLEPALEQYEQYLALGIEDKQVGKWIVDLKRRIDASQRAANVTE